MLPRWTPRRTEALGFLCVIVGLGFVSVPLALITAGLLLITYSYVRANNG